MPKATERNTTDRRAFLSEMAAGVAAGAAAVALAAVPALAVPVDPVFAAIEKFKEARSTLREAEAAHASAESEIQSGDRPDLFPGIFTTTNRPMGPEQGYIIGGVNIMQGGWPRSPTFWPWMTSHADIDKYSPADAYPQDNKLEHEELSAAILRRDARILPLQEAMDDAFDAERAALEELVETVPTTVPGMMALLKWHRDLQYV